MTFYEDESSKAIIEKINTKILDVAEKVSANLVESYPHLNIVAYQFEDYAQTIRAFKILNQNGMVKTARLELIDASRTDN